MNNKFSKIYIEKYNDLFGAFKKEYSRSKNFQNNHNKIPEEFTTLTSSWADSPYGSCPDSVDKSCYYYPPKTIIDSEIKTKCNTSCERNYIYREFNKSNIINSSYCKNVQLPKPCEPNRACSTETVPGKKFVNCNDKIENVKWKTEIQQCDIGEGDCGRKHCIGIWRKCDSNCKRKYKVIQAKVGSGDDCPHADNTEWPCQPGEGDCPLPPGPPGPRGEKGDKGDIGNTGDVGGKGVPGDQGIAGSDGTPGPKGKDGDTGVTGGTGDKGDTGETGMRGPSGTSGRTGLQGIPGVDGQKGDTGYTGEPGETGVKGSKGDKGNTGSIGATGSTGSTGGKGDTGSTGVKGSKGDKGNTGSVGSTGSTGGKGDTGGTGDKGDIGDTGDKGDKGDIGIRGSKGDKGGTGVRGPKGGTGLQGIPGIGDTGSRGPKGQKGDQGPIGIKGEPGQPGQHGVLFYKDPIDCIGQFSNCDNECEMEFQITRPSMNGGKECKYKHGYKTSCEPGQGNCPNELNFSAIHIVMFIFILFLLVSLAIR